MSQVINRLSNRLSVESLGNKIVNRIDEYRSRFVLLTIHNNQHNIGLDKNEIEKIFKLLLKDRGFELMNFVICEENSISNTNFHVCLFLNKQLSTRNGNYFNFFINDKEFKTVMGIKKHVSKDDNDSKLFFCTKKLNISKEKLYGLWYALKNDSNPHSDFSLLELKKIVELGISCNKEFNYSVDTLRLFESYDELKEELRLNLERDNNLLLKADEKITKENAVENMTLELKRLFKKLEIPANLLDTNYGLTVKIDKLNIISTDQFIDSSTNINGNSMDSLLNFKVLELEEEVKELKKEILDLKNMIMPLLK